MENIKFKKLAEIAREFAEIPCEPNHLPDEKEFKFFCNMYPEVRMLVLKMIWTNKSHKYHGEGNTFCHTQMVIREMLKIEGHEDIDLAIAFMHDCMEYDTLQDKVNQVMSLIIEKFPSELRDHSDCEIIRRTLEDVIIDKEDQYLYRDLDEKRNPDDTPYDHLTEKVGPLSMEVVEFIKNLQKNKKELFNNKGHETFGFNNFLHHVDYHQDQLKYRLFKYCIENHMKYGILDKISDEQEIRNIIRGDNFKHLCYLWIADQNGRLSSDPKISFKDILEKLKLNKTFQKILKNDIDSLFYPGRPAHACLDFLKSK